MGNAVWKITLREDLADKLGPVFGVEEFAFGLIEALVGVSSKEVTLRLQEVGWQTLGAVGVVVSEGTTEGRDGNSVGGCKCHHFTPVALSFVEVISQQSTFHHGCFGSGHAMYFFDWIPVERFLCV